MAKRKKSSGPRTRTRTRTIVKTKYRKAPVARRRRRAPSRRGIGGGWIPPREQLNDMAGAAAYGYVEKQMGSDGATGDHWLAKVPRPIDALGFTGNIALAAWVGYKLTKSPILRHVANGTLCVAAYKLGKRGELYTSADEIGGEDDGGYVDVEGLAAEIGEDDGVYAE